MAEHGRSLPLGPVQQALDAHLDALVSRGLTPTLITPNRAVHDALVAEAEAREEAWLGYRVLRLREHVTAYYGVPLEVRDGVDGMRVFWLDTASGEVGSDMVGVRAGVAV